ncbi:hypothetical protein WISP_19352 [Willisornis vidua]|uniref:Uncharacterized protein n=1 Tax=Willisornis vidua TaxID=1566151 RepID=A0ABQ9DUR7_9PASS|nr:hypothetical protein WISP_19352 [Willisornis vidua]
MWASFAVPYRQWNVWMSGSAALSRSVERSASWGGRRLLQAQEQNVTRGPGDGGQPYVRNCTEPDVSQVPEPVQSLLYLDKVPKGRLRTVAFGWILNNSELITKTVQLPEIGPPGHTQEEASGGLVAGILSAFPCVQLQELELWAEKQHKLV